MKNNKQLINKSKIIYYWIFVFVISFFAITYYVVANNSTSKIIDISSFERFLNKGEIKEVTVINKNLAQVTIIRDALYSPDHKNFLSQKNINGPHYVFEIGNPELFQNKLEQAKANGVEFNYYFKTVKNTWLYILISFISLLILVGLWMFFKKELPDSENIKNNYEDKIDKSQNDLNNGKDKLNSKDYDGAIEEFNKVIEIEPKNASAYFHRGYSKFYKFQLIKQTLINVNNTQPIDGVELILENSRRHLLEAVNDYNISLELNPNFTHIYFYRGLARRENSHKGAIEDFNKAIEIDPNNTSAFHCRGISKEKIKDYEGAMADLEKAIEIETDDNHLIEYKKSLKEFKERIHNKIATHKTVKFLEEEVEKLKKQIKKDKKK